MAGIGEDITRRRQLETEIIRISEHERARIGRDLHDTVCQQLVRIGFSSNALHKELARQASPETTLAEKICRMLDTTIRDGCQIARGLCPMKLVGNNLEAALRELARQTQEQTGLVCELEYPAALRVGGQEIPMALYRIAQEALQNAVKHSRASRIRIRLGGEGQGLVLTVTDDGVGFPADARAARGMGVSIMQYRAGEIGGRLEIRRGEGRGTQVRCQVPQDKALAYG
jgi:signal transduction histidine kinase